MDRATLQANAKSTKSPTIALTIELIEIFLVSWDYDVGLALTRLSAR